MSQRHIFAFTGLPGVGKSSVAKKFAEFDGFPIVNMGAEIARHKERAIREDPLNTWEAASALRSEFGEAGPAYAAASQIAAEFIGTDIVVVDGVRSLVEMNTFGEMFDCRVHLIAVTCDEDTRLQRFAERSGYYSAFEDWDNTETVAEALAEYELEVRTEREKKVGLDDAIECAPHTISNNGSLKEAGHQCARLLDSLDSLIRPEAYPDQ